MPSGVFSKKKNKQNDETPESNTIYTARIWELKFHHSGTHLDVLHASQLDQEPRSNIWHPIILDHGMPTQMSNVETTSDNSRGIFKQP